MSCFDDLFKTMGRLREQYEFVALSLAEADPRQPGPPSLAVGMRDGGRLFVAVVDGDGKVGPFEATDRDEFRRRWPRCNIALPPDAK